MVTHLNILAWRIPWTEEPGGLHRVPKSPTQLSNWHFNTYVRRRWDPCASSLLTRNYLCPQANENDDLYCRTCRQFFSSLHNKREHLLGKQHLQNLTGNQLSCCCLIAQLCPTLGHPWTVAWQAPLSMGFPRQEYWTGLPFPSPGDLPNPGIEARSVTSQADSLPSEPQGNMVGISKLEKISTAVTYPEF